MANEYLLNQILFKYEFGEDVKKSTTCSGSTIRSPLQHCATRRAIPQHNRYVEVRLMPDTR